MKNQKYKLKFTLLPLFFFFLKIRSLRYSSEFTNCHLNCKFIIYRAYIFNKIKKVNISALKLALG